MTEEVTDNTDDKNEEIPVVDKIEDIHPLSYAELYDSVMRQFTNQEWGDSEEKIREVFIEKFGDDFENTINPDNEKHQTLIKEIAEEQLAKRLMFIKKEGTSLVDDNVNQAMMDVFNLLSIVNIDLSQTPQSTCKDILKQRAGHLKELDDTYEVLWKGRRLFEWYCASIVSPEVNEDVLKMQDMYRKGIIDREILAFYYYNVAMVYEKYSMQKNNAQAVYKEHYRAIEFMKKSLNKTENNISLVMAAKDFLADEPNYDPQIILDACHRIMDNNQDDPSLYLAHKLYADTLKQNKDIKGFTSNSRLDKIAEHYRTALSYTTASDDKLDILEAIADSQKVHDVRGYISTQLEIADLLSGRKRIRALKNIAYQVQSPEMKAVLLKSAINELVDLDEIRSEDMAMFGSLDRKLRVVAANEPEIIKILDKLRQKYKPKKTQKNNEFFAQMSSKGHDVFTR